MNIAVVESKNKYFIRSPIGYAYDIDDIYWMYCNGDDSLFDDIKIKYNISDYSIKENINFNTKIEAQRFIDEFIIPTIIIKRLTNQ